MNNKMYIHKDFWNILSCIDDRLLIIDYLIKHKSGDFAIGTQNQIAENTGISKNRVGSFIRLLESKNIIKKHSNGVYELLSNIFLIE